MVTAKDVNAVLKNQVDPVDPIDPIAAVSHSDPYPYYAALRAKSGVHWFADLKLWGLVNAPLITDAFNMEQAKVRPTGAPVPAFMHGTQAGEVFGRLARMCDGPQHTLHRARTMLLMRKLDGPLVANGAAQVVGTVASQWRQQRSGAALDESIRALPVMLILAALGFAPHCFTAMLACTDAWLAGLSPLATSAQRAAAIAAMDDLLVLLAENGINSLDDSAAHVAVLMQPHEATAGLIGAGLLRLAADQGLQKAAVAGTLDCGQFGTEVLRHDPPIQNTRRVMAATASFDGQQICAGETVLLVLASAARDLPATDAPDEFRLHRTSATALPPGVGAHACPGGSAALAIAACAWQHIAKHAEDGGLAVMARGVSWRPFVNARIPTFASPGSAHD